MKHPPTFNGVEIEGIVLQAMLDYSGMGLFSAEFEAFLAKHFLRKLDRRIARLKRKRGLLAVHLEHGGRNGK